MDAAQLAPTARRWHVTLKRRSSAARATSQWTGLRHNEMFRRSVSQSVTRSRQRKEDEAAAAAAAAADADGDGGSDSCW